MKIKLKSWVAKGVITTIVLASFLFIPAAPAAQAASLTSMSANASRLQENTNSNYEIFFVSPSGIQSGTSDDIIITFSSDFTLAAEAVANFDFAVGNSGTCTSASYTEETLALTASATEWGVDVTGNVVTFEPETDDTHAGGLCYRVRMGTIATSGGTGAANTVQNGALDDDDTITFSGGFGDTGTISVDIIADDQVDITATVAPSITFSISDTDVEFGTLSAADDTFADNSAGNATEVEAHQLAAGTNATGGYVIYVSGATLTSGGDTIDAIGGTNTASTPGTEQFGARYTASGGSGSVDSPYSAAGFAYNGVASPDNIASVGGPSSTTTYSARYVANITSSTEAGSYATTLTYTATATF
jgi:hypothetical protein